MLSIRPIAIYSVVILSVLAIQGCVTKSLRPLPASLEHHVEVPGFHHIRGWGNEYSSSLQQSIMSSVKQELASNHGQLKSEENNLILSGGGGDGAFGAGFLCGWSKTGKRPKFDVVTGISTGALIAPFAFLGPEYDPLLKKSYTTITDKDIYKEHSIPAIVLGLTNIVPLTSFADNKPITKLVEQSIDATVLRQIAVEHKKGRRLFVGTTQFNAQRLVIWDMGAIAASNSPEALALFRKILVASAALPVLFPPQYFTVTAEGKKYTEMHVDGGLDSDAIYSENAVVPHSIQKYEASLLKGRKKTYKLYIIRNGKISPQWNDVKQHLDTIITNTLDSLIKAKGRAELFRIYAYAKRDGVDYNLAYLPPDFSEKTTTPFDKAYMNKLFARGYQLGSSNYKWAKHPPGYTPIGQEP